LATSVPFFERQYAIACKVREPANQSATAGSMGAKFPMSKFINKHPVAALVLIWMALIGVMSIG
jgi:hypothetical protein